MLRNIGIVVVLIFGFHFHASAEVISELLRVLPSTLALQSTAPERPSDIVLFIGRFHPLLVHLPIGFLLLAFLLECCSRLERFRELGSAVPFSLLLGGISAIGTAGTGYLLSLDGGYGEGILSTHMWLGIAVALLSLAAFVMRSWFYEKPLQKQAYLGMLGAMMVCLMAAGHYGGSLTHGSDYLVQYMPDPLRSVAGLPPRQDRRIKKIENLDSARVFQEVIHPILDTRCVSCHNPEKKKGELLLTTYEELMQGGESGPVLKVGSADSSDLVHRLLLPEADEDHMPPEGKLQLTSDQVDLISWWINQGAPMDQAISEMHLPEDISEALHKLTVEGTSFLAKTEVPKADTTVINNLRSQGIMISPIAGETNFLQVKYPPAEPVDLEQLTPISRQVTWLDLARTPIADSTLSGVAEFRNITRLHLENTDIGDQALEPVGALEHLEYLNLYGTQVSDEGLKHIAAIESLKSLYIWQTKVTSTGASELKGQLSELYIDTGWNQGESGTEEVDSAVEAKTE